MSNKKESDMKKFEEMMEGVDTLNEKGQRTAAIFAQGYIAGRTESSEKETEEKDSECQKAG